MAAPILPAPQSTNHLGILAVLAALIHGNVPAGQAIEDLTMLGANPALIQSVRQIEQMFSVPESDYCGPMDSAVRKLRGDA